MGGAMQPMVWGEILRVVMSMPTHQNLMVDSALVPHPSTVEAFRASKGTPQGQRSDWRYALEDGRGLHVREFEGFYLVHWDMHDPSIDLIGHLACDTPRLFMLSALALGALGGLGVGFGRGQAFKTSTLVGAVVGVGLGVLFLGKGSRP